tara:strand:- start:8850 stop:9110 length:261 start_codon:yes stop_codon:yes gene_type:complete
MSNRKTKQNNIVVLKDLNQDQQRYLEILREKFDQRTNSKAIWTCVEHYIKLLEYQDLLDETIKSSNTINQNISFIQQELIKMPSDE